MFKKYQHIEKVGTSTTEGITNGTCYIFPKIDGCNCSIWYDSGIKAGSRNRELTLENDHYGFYKWILEQPQFVKFFEDYPDVTLYGEWLIPHTLKTYEQSAWNKFYVFDVLLPDNAYLHYDMYDFLLQKYNIDYIPALCKIENPTIENLVSMLQKNTYLIQDGKGIGEGIVIKNYDYTNKYGKTVWAKIVVNDFRTKHTREKLQHLQTVTIEDKIVSKYVTKVLVEKEFAKIENWESKLISRLLSTVYYCLITEELWNILKEHHNPVIDFKRLHQATIRIIKELKPELF